MNKLVLPLLAVFLLCAGGRGVGAPVPVLSSADISRFNDNYRLVIIFPANPKDDEDVANRSDELHQWEAKGVSRKMEPRDLLVFQVTDPKIVAALRRKLAPNEKGYHVWLISLKGKLVLSSDRNIEPEQIFDQVDVLPRRSSEIHLLNNWDAGKQSGP